MDGMGESREQKGMEKGLPQIGTALQLVKKHACGGFFDEIAPFA